MGILALSKKAAVYFGRYSSVNLFSKNSRLSKHVPNKATPLIIVVEMVVFLAEMAVDLIGPFGRHSAAVINFGNIVPDGKGS